MLGPHLLGSNLVTLFLGGGNASQAARRRGSSMVSRYSSTLASVCFVFSSAMKPPASSNEPVRFTKNNRKRSKIARIGSSRASTFSKIARNGRTTCFRAKRNRLQRKDACFRAKHDRMQLKGDMLPSEA